MQEMVLPEHAEECESLMQAELEKWWDHTNAVREAKIASTRRCQQGTGPDKVYNNMWGRAGGDVLPHLGDKDIEEMNKCLKRHGCTHLFQKEHTWDHEPRLDECRFQCLEGATTKAKRMTDQRSPK